MGKNLNISILMDFYGQLLTEKQADALELYYNQDFSLSEIADDLNISRQGVRDSIKRGEKQLTDLEESLGLAKKFTDMSAKLEELSSIVQTLEEKHIPGIEEELKSIKALSAELKEEF